LDIMDEETHEVLPEGERGEIVISTETAERNAKIYSYSLEKEILYLIIHGILHLKGYKDNNRKDALKMKKQQNIIFKKLLDGQKI